MPTINKIEKAITIAAAPAQVWMCLTEPKLMGHWMGESEMKLKVRTDWTIGNPITISGFHHIKFQNTGRVLEFEPQKIIQYTHLSSLSRLPENVENHSVISFVLTAQDENTLLTLYIERFPTETIMKHLDFYWQGTISVLKNFIEQIPEEG